jgi:hypothetical protein
MHKALQLALEIYARVPLIPQSLFMGGLDIQIPIDDNVYRNGTLASGENKKEAMFLSHATGIFVCHPSFLAFGLRVMSKQPICQITLLWGTLSHENILPLLGIYEAMASASESTSFYYVIPRMEHGTLPEWRRKANPPGLEIRDRVSLILHFHGWH